MAKKTTERLVHGLHKGHAVCRAHYPLPPSKWPDGETWAGLAVEAREEINCEGCLGYLTICWNCDAGIPFDHNAAIDSLSHAGWDIKLTRPTLATIRRRLEQQRVAKERSAARSRS